MNKIILSIAIIFVFAALIPNTQPVGIGNSFYAYFFYAKHFIFQNYFVFILGFIVLTIIWIRALRHDKSTPRHKKYSLSVFQVINTFVIGIFLSYVILFLIAFVELNILSISMHINEKILGIVNDNNTIINTLKRNSYAPKIVTSEDRGNAALKAIASSISGKDNFYGNYIISSVPKYFIIPMKKFNSSILLVDDTLILTELNAHDIEQISPVVIHQLVQRYFSDRLIKSDVKISIMSKKEYQIYRQNNYKENLVKIDKEIVNFENQKETAEQNLEVNKSRLVANKDAIIKSTAAKDSEYKECLANGKYTLVYCKNLLNKWESIELQNEEIANLTEQIASDESKLKEAEKYFNFYTTLGKSLRVLTGNIPDELGVFMPKNTIKVTFNTASKHKIADYLNTLTHEYIHYASYNSEKKKLSDVFFEEGLTEYFARQTLKDNLNLNTNLGYPIFAKIIEQMTKRIVESDLEEVYFTKDQAKLEELLDRVYGENFYKNNRLLFLTLQYTSDQKKAIEIANEIMEKIGGDPIDEADLLYSSSEL